MSFNKTEKFLELARRAAASRQGMNIAQASGYDKNVFSFARRIHISLRQQF
jgi:hypothetical protein